MGDGKMIGAGKKVTIRYELRNDRNELLEQNDGDSYEHGKTVIVPGLERALAGRAAGDKFSVVVEARDGYGPRRRGPGAQPIPRSSFPADAPLVVGMPFEAQSPDGRPVKLFVIKVESEQVFVDTNHPFAGETLYYEIEVLDVQ